MRKTWPKRSSYARLPSASAVRTSRRPAAAPACSARAQCADAPGPPCARARRSAGAPRTPRASRPRRARPSRARPRARARLAAVRPPRGQRGGQALRAEARQERGLGLRGHERVEPRERERAPAGRVDAAEQPQPRDAAVREDPQDACVTGPADASASVNTWTSCGSSGVERAAASTRTRRGQLVARRARRVGDLDARTRRARCP